MSTLGSELRHVTAEELENALESQLALVQSNFGVVTTDIYKYIKRIEESIRNLHNRVDALEQKLK
jgi:hypothetical protein